MQFITSWCEILRIQDPMAVQVAAGTFAAGSLLLIGYIVLGWILAYLSIIAAYFESK